MPIYGDDRVEVCSPNEVRVHTFKFWNSKAKDSEINDYIKWIESHGVEIISIHHYVGSQFNYEKENNFLVAYRGKKGE